MAFTIQRFLFGKALDEPPVVADKFDLRASVDITVPSTSWVAVPHDERLIHVQTGHLVWAIKSPRDQMDLLMDDPYVVPDITEPLVSRFFNLSTKPVRIKAGTVVARLVSVRLE
jgi:hypothetical protein